MFDSQIWTWWIKIATSGEKKTISNVDDGCTLLYKLGTRTVGRVYTLVPYPPCMLCTCYKEAGIEPRKNGTDIRMNECMFSRIVQICFISSKINFSKS